MLLLPSANRVRGGDATGGARRLRIEREEGRRSGWWGGDMRGGGGRGGGGGGGGRVPFYAAAAAAEPRAGDAAAIPPASRKLVQGLKGILTDRSEAEIYATLLDCGMDPDVAVERLISQGIIAPGFWRPSSPRLPPDDFELYRFILFCGAVCL